MHSFNTRWFTTLQIVHFEPFASIIALLNLHRVPFIRLRRSHISVLKGFISGILYLELKYATLANNNITPDLCTMTDYSTF